MFPGCASTCCSQVQLSSPERRVSVVYTIQIPAFESWHEGDSSTHWCEFARAHAHAWPSTHPLKQAIDENIARVVCLLNECECSLSKSSRWHLRRSACAL